MSSVKGRFADQDSYVLTVLIQTAGSNQADLNVVMQESDYLQASSAAYQVQGLTITPINPIPNVTIVAQQTHVGRDFDPNDV